MRRLIRTAGLTLARLLGAQVRDFETGEVLGRALIVPWRGQIHLIGLTEPVRVLFRPQQRLTYWKQEIVFTRHPQADFPRVLRKGDSAPPE